MGRRTGQTHQGSSSCLRYLGVRGSETFMCCVRLIFYALEQKVCLVTPQHVPPGISMSP